MSGRTCDRCGHTMRVGEELFAYDNTHIDFGEDLVFCSYNCLKEYAMENIDDLLDNVVECDTVEDSDPYDRYGVSRGDF